MLPERSISTRRDSSSSDRDSPSKHECGILVSLSRRRSTLAGRAASAPLRSFTPYSSTSRRRGSTAVRVSTSSRDVWKQLGDSDDSLSDRNSRLAGRGAVRSAFDRWRRRKFGQRFSRSAKKARLGRDLLNPSETSHIKQLSRDC